MHCEVPSQAPAAQAALVPCPYCHALFTPRRAWSVFCSNKCRDGYNVDFGTQGIVISVRRLKHGISVVMHFDGPAAERAVRLIPRELVRLVKKPCI